MEKSVFKVGSSSLITLAHISARKWVKHPAKEPSGTGFVATIDDLGKAKQRLLCFITRDEMFGDNTSKKAWTKVRDVSGGNTA